jgi:heavy metal sensor kinase
MSLANRISAFFLGTLACVLLGFSVALYLVADGHLHRQANARLQAALDVLAAAAERHTDGVEWETTGRRLELGGSTPDEAVFWSVTDGQGSWVDGSAAAREARFFECPESSEVPYNGQPWRVSRRVVRPDPASTVDPPEPGAKRYAELILTAAAPLGPIDASLRRLAVLVSGLSVGLWLSAALVGRWLCWRALRPLTHMAEASRQITAAELSWRLPATGTGDELEELGRAFNDLLARLHESFERQQRFTGDASHQLRTPLTALLGQIDVALRRPRDSEEYRRVLGAVQGQAINLNRIVEGLLFLARADAEALAPEPDQLELRAWLTAHRETWASHVRAADLQLEFGDGPLRVRAHGPLLAQALDNLLENACKYSDPGTPVMLRAWQEPGAVCVAVEDRGRGIDAGDLPHVFEPFYRSPETRRLGVSGVGLGLAVAARVIKALGGQVAVKSELGQGSLFTIRLPSDC